MMEIPEMEARKLFGERLHVAALAVVVEKDKIRVVHDGTNKVHVNHMIRAKDQTISPSAGEVRSLLQERKLRGLKTLSVLGDVSKAHRRVKILPRDWGLQACQVEKDKLWINKVGTYGIASAAYWWARLASMVIVRFFYFILAHSGNQDALLFADDLMALVGSKEELLDVGAVIAIWMALGLPWKWAKFRGAMTSTGSATRSIGSLQAWGYRRREQPGWASGSMSSSVPKLRASGTSAQYLDVLDFPWELWNIYGPSWPHSTPGARPLGMSEEQDYHGP